MVNEYEQLKKELDKEMEKDDWDFNTFFKAFRVILFITILMLFGTIISALFASGNIYSSALNDIEYTFANDHLFNSTGLGQQRWYDNSSNTFNVRPREFITDEYNASYSFENDINGLEPADYSIVDAGGEVYVLSNLIGHDKVVIINDTSIGAYAGMFQDVSLTYGNIEYWWLTNDTSQQSLFMAYGTGFSGLFYLSINQDKFQFWNASGWNDLGLSAQNNTWYHVNIAIELTTNGYDGLSQYDWNVHVNGEKFGDFDCWNNLPEFIRYQFASDLQDYTAINYYSGVDAIGIYLEGFYNSTYTFTDDGIGNVPSGWTDYIGAGTSLGVVGSITNHTYVVEFDDTSGSEWCYITQSAGIITYGTIEFWWYIVDASLPHSFDTGGGAGANYITQLITINNIFRYRDYGGWNDLGLSAQNNTWYHIAVNFEHTTGEYKGLSQYYYSIAVNNNTYGEFHAMNDESYTEHISFSTSPSTYGEMYIDAVGYSWDINYNIGDNYYEIKEYNIGDNLEPYRLPSEIEHEVDEWQFRHNPDTRIQYVDGSDNPSGWIDYGDIPSVIDDVNTINYGGTQAEYQRWISVHVDNTGGLYRTFSGMNDSKYDITVNFGINQLDDTDVGANAIIIYFQSGGNYISYLRFWNDGDLELYYDGGSNVIGTFDITNNYTANFFLDFTNQIQHFTLTYWLNDTVLYEYFVPFYEAGTVISKIQYYHICTGADEVDSDLFSISMYNTTGSCSDDVGEFNWYGVGYPRLDPIYDKWYYSEFNLIDFYGHFSNVSIFHEMFGGITFDDFVPWTTVDTHDIFNIYHVEGNQDPISAEITVWMKYNFTFDSISINGVKLVDEDSNSFPLEMNNSTNMDVSQSYFYVSGNRLYYTMTTNNFDLEFIEATFDVNNQNTINYTLLWGGLKTYENMIGEFRIKYTDDTFTPFLFKTVPIFQNAIIPQGYNIDTFILLITDNNNDAMGTITGYLESPTLIFTTGALINIVLVDYLSILTPILLITIITITIWQTTKKKVGPILIIPTMVLMSFSVFMLEMIPIWLLFIILISSGVLIYSKWEEQFLIFSSFATMITGFLSYAGIIDFWLFYMTFIIMVGYLIFGIRRGVRG